MKQEYTDIIIGGGPAGFFGAIACASRNPMAKIAIFEKSNQLLTKVRISGGGRCNVTHSCFNRKELVKNYPRGNKELIGPFSRFFTLDTIQWFENCGVPLKTEEDGRMFPLSNTSETIVNCLLEQAEKHNIDIYILSAVNSIEKTDDKFILQVGKEHREVSCQRILFATGSTGQSHTILQTLGHNIVKTVPSLFTFNVPSSPLLDLSGISLTEVKISLDDFNLFQTGPILLTHWGFSGPAILKLSAWGAKLLADKEYKVSFTINWEPNYKQNELIDLLKAKRQTEKDKQIGNDNFERIPKNLWKRFLDILNVSQNKRWHDISNNEIQKIANKLHADTYVMEGKTTYKQEFVTCGGVKLDEINFKTMESRIIKDLYFAGEVIDIDAITGGFNFQNAWTTGFIAGFSMAEAMKEKNI